ncbi:BTB/POZ domain-containing protein KCTD9 isoform X2 [Rhipicephalus sanguineus]|uniref:BTB/POZ domain-containing protein KCTD9 isoform X2 n=1 Tax=Rhipicephalus sanguineus TaxID=34632 RepID=UPI0018944846|nr:BTB/POZ domain-containing protein KCTD9 isoform X2 [Rhipicephalus sanguineus]
MESEQPAEEKTVRVVVYRNGAGRDGKVVLVPRTLDELLKAISAKFGIQAKRLFTSKGGEIDDTSLIRDEETLFVSSGESFIAPQCLAPEKPDWVLLNVGGKHFATTRSTLVSKEPHSMLGRLFSEGADGTVWPSAKDHHGAYLVDRSPTYFEPLLNYLRHGQLILDRGVSPRGVLEEAKFYGIESVIPELERISQGVDLSGADLSRLDLRHINFKWANLRKCRLTWANLSYCCLERADLTLANLEGAQLVGAKMMCANMEAAHLRSCNMEDPAGNSANLEGVNLKDADLDGSQMAGVNLRVATLKNANLQNCHLRQAILAGADLENCNLSGSDLHEANLRGANLKDAVMELMLTPLHMAQAI